MERPTADNMSHLNATPPVCYEIEMMKQHPSRKRSLWSRLFKTKTTRSSGSRKTVTTTTSSSRLISDNDSTFSESFLEEDDDEVDKAMTVAAEVQGSGLPSLIACSNNESSSSPRHLCNQDDTEEAVQDMLDRADEARSAGEYFRSLTLYERVLLEYPRQDPAESANLCYACTKLCGLLQDHESALNYAKMELQFTLQIAETSLAVARCYHELARISKYGLGETAVALEYYRIALSIEQTCLRNAVVASRHKKTKQHTSAIREAAHHIRETKECIGRTQFELGNLDDALRML